MSNKLACGNTISNTHSLFSCLGQSWSRLVEDYQALCRQLESVECSIPTVGLVEETEERLIERISLFQVRDNIQTAHTYSISASICIHTILTLKAAVVHACLNIF